MQEKNSDIYTCPNCSNEYPANLHYCAHCGQETHLHEDSFRGMVVHFIAHYFHYESKFGSTFRTLLLQPGELTLAYIQKKRAKYLSPITLYILISVVYFIVASLSTSVYNSLGWNTTHQAAKTITATQPATTHAHEITQAEQYEAVAIFKHMVTVWEAEDYDHALEDKFIATLPKVFFFMIPLLAFILQLLFYKRTHIPFTQHAVFALYFHSFYFTVSIAEYLVPGMFVALSKGIYIAVYTACFVYMYQALRRVYNTCGIKSLLYAVVAWPLYYASLWLIMVAIWLWFVDFSH
jgi:hypothetical protein